MTEIKVSKIPRCMALNVVWNSDKKKLSIVKYVLLRVGIIRQASSDLVLKYFGVA